MTMLENEAEAGAQYQPHHDATFVDFGSDRRSDSYVITIIWPSLFFLKRG